MNPLQRRVAETFRARYGEPPAFVVRAPGRVNLIGEHTDYNDGFVLPMAIDRAVWIAFRPAEGGRVRVFSVDFDEERTFALAAVATLDEHHGEGWVDYLKGTAWALQAAGYTLRGWEGAMAGDVPRGAGLSSSAALELATARAFATASGLPWDPAAMARLGQRAENEWVGMQCGIMDQMISAAGQAGHALLIDCRSLETEPVPLPPGTVSVILDTSTRRGLVGSAYNERRRQCEAAAAHFGVRALRDVSVEAVEAASGTLEEVTRRRARHVVSENARVLQAVEAMRSGDAPGLGALMDASHESLRHDFEVSSPELDRMADLARRHGACYGARMTGAGFGGCAVALVEARQRDSFAAEVGAAYEEATGLAPSIYVSGAAEGAAVM